MIDIVARLGQHVPVGVRGWVLRSRLAPPTRRILNSLSRSKTRMTSVPLGGPLAGHRMLLDWQTHKAFVFGVYERQVVWAVESTLAPGSVAVDVGAHIGYYTLLLRKLVGSTGRVVAFEPWPDVAAVLKRNASLNGYPDIIIEQQAVADRSGKVTMTRRNDDPLTSMSSVASEGELDVAAVALDDYFAPGEPVSFVKVDVEGAECLVLEGMRRILADHRPILVVEAHGSAGRPAMEMLEQQRYRVTVIDAGGHLLATPA